MNTQPEALRLAELEAMHERGTIRRGHIYKMLAELRRLHAENEQLRERQEPVAWCPDVCPITGLPFFMWIEHYETSQRVPTYGGPHDSYTIPVRDKDGSYCRERYDHDNGWWVTDEVEDVGIQIVSDQAFVYDEEHPQKSVVEQVHAYVSSHDTDFTSESMAAMVRDFIAAEREACAKVAEDTDRMVLALLNVTSQPKHIAAAIRARGQA